MNKLDSQFYTVAEAAQILRFSPLTIYKWIKVGQIRVVRFGSRSYRIKKKEIANYL